MFARGCPRKSASLAQKANEGAKAETRPRSFSLFNGRPNRALQKSTMRHGDNAHFAEASLAKDTL